MITIVHCSASAAVHAGRTHWRSRAAPVPRPHARNAHHAQPISVCHYATTPQSAPLLAPPHLPPPTVTRTRHRTRTQPPLLRPPLRTARHARRRPRSPAHSCACARRPHRQYRIAPRLRRSLGLRNLTPAPHSHPPPTTLTRETNQRRSRLRLPPTPHRHTSREINVSHR